MKKLFLAASALFGAIPGLAIIQSGLGSPPGYHVLFGGVVESFGVLTLILLWVNRAGLQKLKPKRVTRLTITAAVICFVCIGLYIGLYKHCVVTSTVYNAKAYYPLWVTGDIADIVARSGGRSAAIDEYGIGEVAEAINKMPSIVLTVTTIVLLLVYQAVFSTLAIAFGLVGFQQGHSIDDGK